MSKAVGYIRVSTKAQAGEDRFGIPEQKSSIKQWAESQGYTDIEWYVDNGYSGSSQDRPALQELLAEIKNLQVPVIVAKIDRWARDTFLHLYLEKELVKAGSELLSVAENGFNDTEDPMNELMREIMMSFAKFESQRITARMSGGRRQKAKSGGHATGRTPFGYKKDLDTGTLKVDADEAKIVQSIFYLHRKEGRSLRAIAEWLNRNHYTTKAGNKWRAKSVSNILNNSKYKGEIKQKVGGETITTHNPELKIV